MRARIQFFILAAALLFMPVTGEAAEVKALVDHQKIGEEDPLQLTIKVIGEGSQAVDFIDLPSLEGFDVASTSERTSISIVNGVTTSSKDFLFTLLPRKQGTFTIPAVSVDLGGGTLKTEPVQVTVAAGSVIGSRQRSRPDPRFDPFAGRSRQRTEKKAVGDDIFVRAEISRPEVFYGEQLLLTYKLYTRYNIRGLDMSQPSLTGFWVESIELPQRLKPEVEMVGGKQYSVFTVRQSALFPSTSGELVIDPVTFTVDAETRGSDPFFGSIFGERERIYRKTQPVTLKVKPLPRKGKPADFSGAVGDFELRAEVDKKEARVNDAVNLKITIQGRGNLKTVQEQKPPEHPDFKVFESKETSDIGFKQGIMQGRKSWEYVLMPTAAGEHRLEPVRFSFFDPAAAAYKTHTGPEFTVQVDPGDEAEEMSIAQLPDGRVVRQRHADIRYIKPAPEKLTNDGAFLYRKSIFYLLLLLPLMLNIGALIYRKRRESRSRDLAGYRFRQARKKANRFLKEAGQLMKSSDRNQFAETLTKGLYAYLADKLNLSAAGLTLVEVEKGLRAKSISPEALEGMQKHLEQLEMARFGRHDMQEAEMAKLFEAARNLIWKVEKECA